MNVSALISSLYVTVMQASRKLNATVSNLETLLYGLW